MNRLSPLLFALAAALSIGSAAEAQPTTTRTPLTAPVELTGQTGGSQSSACGNINPEGGQIVSVSETFSALNFTVKSEGDYTLLI
ncbi:MAG: hypothetical protein WBD47_06730, partial [Phormidesmis sp.]